MREFAVNAGSVMLNGFAVTIAVSIWLLMFVLSVFYTVASTIAPLILAYYLFF